MTDENGAPIIATPPEVSRAVDAVNRQRWTEGLLVVVVSILVVGLIATTAWNTYRLRYFSQRQAREQVQQAKAQEFGLKAIQCILANFAEHRATNQDVHDAIAAKLGVAPTPHTPLPQRLTEEEFHAVCDPFGPAAFKEDSHVATTTTTRH